MPRDSRHGVLITGGAGFIGSHLAESLHATGRQVLVLDDLSTGSARNLRGLIGKDAFAFVHGSTADADLVERLASEVEEIYHLAAAVGVRLAFEKTVQTLETNVRGIENVLRGAARSGRGPKVLFASSSEVYGRDPRPARESFTEAQDLCLGTSLRWGYGCSKAIGEYLCRAYTVQMGLPTAVARLFNVVGPRQSSAYGMVVPRLVRQALRGEPLTVYSDGTQVRTFTWVSDACRALAGIMESPASVGEVYNVGAETPIRIRDLAEQILRMTGSSSGIRHIPYEEAFDEGFEDIGHRVPEVAKLRRLLGFAPSGSLEDLLARVIDYERKAPGRLQEG